jgi:hypothetical protein
MPPSTRTGTSVPTGYFERGRAQPAPQAPLCPPAARLCVACRHHDPELPQRAFHAICRSLFVVGSPPGPERADTKEE